jgi:threonine/homoserine/homoserine lactone efflux protein
MSAAAAFWPLLGAALGELAVDATRFFHNAVAFDHTCFPVDPTLFYAFIGAAILIEVTPGPNIGYLVTLAITRGRAAAFARVVSVTLGLAVYMVAAAFGITKIFLRYPRLYQALRVAGALFLLWLAFDAWRVAAGAEDGEKDERSHFALALRGFLANVLNPKSAMFYIALLPPLIQRAGPVV